MGGTDLRQGGILPFHRLLVVVLFVGPLMVAAAPVAAGPQSWTPIGPDGATVEDLAADPVHPGVFYAACGISGIFASRDGGSTWYGASHGLGSSTVVSIAVDPTATNRVVAGTFEGLFRSDDFAATWSPVSAVPLSPAWTFAVSPRDGTIYAGGEAAENLPAVWISRDGGLTWRGSLPGQAKVSSLLLMPSATGEVLYAATSGFKGPEPYLLRSSDGGRSWTPLTAGLPALTQPDDGLQLAGDLVHGRLYLNVTFIDPDGFPLDTETLRSTDGGTSWQRSGPGGAPIAVSFDGTVVAGSYRSVDGGARWTAAAPAPPNAARYLADPFAPTVLLAGTAWGGVFRTADDGESWQTWRQELAGTYISALAAGPHHLWAVAGNIGLFRAAVVADDLAIEWVAADLGLPADAFSQDAVVAVDPQRPRIVYYAWSGTPNSQGGTTGGGFARSRSSGDRWQILPVGEWSILRALRMWVDPSLSQVIYQLGEFASTSASATCRLLRSSDRGVTWSCIDPPNTFAETFVPAPQSPGVLYAVGESDTIPNRHQLWRSQDHGSTWSMIPVTGLETAGYPKLLVPDPANAAHLLLVAGDLLYASANGGGNWQRVGEELPSPIYGLVVDPLDPARVYALSHLGVYASHDSGARFGSLYGGLPEGDNGFIPNLVLDPADPRRLFVGLGAHGAYAYTFP